MEKRDALHRKPETELLEAALARPESEGARIAASELLRRYQRRVYAWAIQYVRHPETAADLAQEILVAAYRNLPSFRGRACFSSWLFAIARNKCISQLRRSSLWREEPADPESILSEERDLSREMDLRLAEWELLGIIRAKLEPIEQDAIWLRYFEQMPVEAVTRMLGLENAAGARGVLQRARRKLRPILLRRLKRTESRDVGNHR